ncbi:hypothetical protein IV203_025763 [Nitzschia inconspicua]|uniref:Uncharacterized protein n=1 Tax=Nitzschia inconspicua TaxID=303405 RepID=A0A9K3PW89_9STRA|nr:hypothetical protein IV203_025763 [Nitzschia inconspicua]
MALSSTPGNNLYSHPVDIASNWQRYRQRCKSHNGGLLQPHFASVGLIQPHYALILAMVSHSGYIISHSGYISPPRQFDNPTRLSLKSHNDGLLQPDLAFIQQWWLTPAPLCPYSGNGIPLRPISPSRHFDNPTGLSFILRQLWLLSTPPAPAVLLIRPHPWFPSLHDVDIFDYLWPIPPKIFPVLGYCLIHEQNHFSPATVIATKFSANSMLLFAVA